jgi:hypothetical protein
MKLNNQPLIEFILDVSARHYKLICRKKITVVKDMPFDHATKILEREKIDMLHEIIEKYMANNRSLVKHSITPSMIPIREIHELESEIYIFTEEQLMEIIDSTLNFLREGAGRRYIR